MIYVSYSAPYTSGMKPFEEDKKGQQKMFNFLKDLMATHARERGNWSSIKGTWRGHINIFEFKLLVTFKKADLWT